MSPQMVYGGETGQLQRQFKGCGARILIIWYPM